MNGRATWRRAFVASGRAGKPTTPLPRARPSGAQPIIVEKGPADQLVNGGSPNGFLCNILENHGSAVGVVIG